MASQPSSTPDSTSFAHRLVEVGGHQIAVVDNTAGRSGPPLVFVHGITLSVSLWPELLRESPLDQMPWISLGLPAHFPSEVPEEFDREDVTAELFSDSVLAPVKECFGDRPVHLIGWSTGGFASLAAAAREPQRVASVVSLSGFARGTWGWHLGTMQVLARRRLGKKFVAKTMGIIGGSPRLFRIFMGSLAKQKLEVTDELMEILLEDCGQHDPQTISELVVGIRELDLTPSLADIQAPVLLLSGARDRVIRATETQHLQDNLPNARHVEIPDVGHIFYGEALEENLEQIGLWIAEQENVSG